MFYIFCPLPYVWKNEMQPVSMLILFSVCIRKDPPQVPSTLSMIDYGLTWSMLIQTQQDLSYITPVVLPCSAWLNMIQINVPYPLNLIFSLVKYSNISLVLPWCSHDDVIKWKHFPRYWPFVRGTSHKGQWRGALMFTLIWAPINGWVNNCEAGDLRRNRAHYDVIVMICLTFPLPSCHRCWRACLCA